MGPSVLLLGLLPLSLAVHIFNPRLFHLQPAPAMGNKKWGGRSAPLESGPSAFHDCTADWHTWETGSSGTIKIKRERSAGTPWDLQLQFSHPVHLEVYNGVVDLPSGKVFRVSPPLWAPRMTPGLEETVSVRATFPPSGPRPALEGVVANGRYHRCGAAGVRTTRKPPTLLYHGEGLPHSHHGDHTHAPDDHSHDETHDHGHGQHSHGEDHTHGPGVAPHDHSHDQAHTHHGDHTHSPDDHSHNHDHDHGHNEDHTHGPGVAPHDHSHDQAHTYHGDGPAHTHHEDHTHSPDDHSHDHDHDHGHNEDHTHGPGVAPHDHSHDHAHTYHGNGPAHTHHEDHTHSADDHSHDHDHNHGHGEDHTHDPGMAPHDHSQDHAHTYHGTGPAHSHHEDHTHAPDDHSHNSQHDHGHDHNHEEDHTHGPGVAPHDHSHDHASTYHETGEQHSHHSDHTHAESDHSHDAEHDGHTHAPDVGPDDHSHDHDHDHVAHTGMTIQRSGHPAWPNKVLGLYILLADDDEDGFDSAADWDPELFPWQQEAANVLFFTFIHPDTMAIPPSYVKLAASRGSGLPGAVPKDTVIMFAIGGYSYSLKPNPWHWLTSREAAEEMAVEVAAWPEKYGCDGIDLDLEEGAGAKKEAGPNMIHFIRKLKQLAPGIIVSQPTYGYPQVQAEIDVINASWDSSGTSAGLADTLGLMVYEGTQALNYVKNYAAGSSQWQGFPITASAPTSAILLGCKGAASSDTITSLARASVDQDLGGIMVWYASIKNGFHYTTFWDASTHADSVAGYLAARKMLEAGPAVPRLAQARAAFDWSEYIRAQ